MDIRNINVHGLAIGREQLERPKQTIIEKLDIRKQKYKIRNTK